MKFPPLRSICRSAVVLGFAQAFFFVPQVFASSNYCSTGFDSSLNHSGIQIPDSYNGTWVETGTNNGEPYYVLDSHYLYLMPDFASYAISDILDQTSGGTDFYQASMSTDPTSPMMSDNYGGQTAGTLVPCGIPPPPPPSPTDDPMATTTVIMDSPNQDLFYGFCLFFLGMLSFVYIFKKR